MKRMQIILVIIILIVVGLVLFILPPGVKLKKFTDANGNALKNSVSEKCYIDTDGGKLGMFIMAKDDTMPVILFCGGGPGISEYLLEYEYPTDISNDFVVCYLEYRGTGLSYDS